MPALRHSPDGQIKRRQKSELAESVGSPPVPVADGVHEARGHEATGCHSRAFGGGEPRTGAVGMSPRGRGERISTHPPAEPRVKGKRETWAAPVAK